ncbi:MAG: efflux RND transporter permease subunit [Phenylobacterium sp.]|uniref:efflux RND transporter permease subunit n=1 Tax=Phenylobacterium sp. TaxID=1871053 RepID=UPI001834EEA4|nr:efflux RND transporter permease subunit [Phenylobacterium sp.]MBA4794964.1 efflux RND transporter permease subunit [Phenylobacterium sp.]
MSFDPAGFAVRRWQFTLVAFALLTVLGLNAFFSIPRSEDPHFPIPIMVVRAVLPGAEPTEMEQLVADPLEDALDGLDDVEEIRSTSQDGAAVVQVSFDWSVEPDRKYDEVVREVNAIRSRLPDGLALLEVRRARTTEVAIVQVALVSDHLPMRRLEKVAERLRERLARTPGVRQAEYWGAPPSEVQVALDLPKLSALQLPATAVADALAAAGAEAPIGAVHAGDRRFNVKSGGAFRDLEAIRQTPVRSVDGRVVRVQDVAQVGWAQAEATHLTRFNGQRALFVTVKQKDGADVAKVTRSVNAALDEFERSLPPGVKLERAFQQSENVKHRLNRLFRDFGLALTLVLITLLPLGLRAGVVVMMSIPLSLLMGLAVMQGFGFTLNQLAIAGFVLSLGLLVDDSIVVTENIARRLREGEDRTAAAVNGTRQISLAVLGCTATLMLAFLPLMALPEGSGAYIRSLPVAVLTTVGASLIVSLTIVPFLASRILSRHEDPEGNALLRTINGGIHRFYTPILHRALARPWIALAIILGICATTIPMLGAIGSSLFPAAETPQFIVRIETQQGTALAKTDEALRFVERRLAQEEAIVWRAANLGRGNPQIFYNVNQAEPQPNYAEVYASLEAWEPGESGALLDALRRDFDRYPGARIRVIVFENGPPIEAPIAVRLQGQNLEVLKALAGQAEGVLKATPGARDVVNPMRLDRTDLELGLDEAKAAALGVPAGAGRRIARLALSGEPVARYRDADGDDYAVNVRLPMAGRNELAALEDIYLPTTTGSAVPLGVVAEPELTSSPARIDRIDRLRTVTVTAYVSTGYLTSAVTEDVVARLERELNLPPGYTLSLGGQAEAQSESFAGLGAAIMIAVFGILAVLVLEFGKFKTALVVAGIIPLGLFGAVTALWITGNSMSFTATIGMIALIGIEIKNSILLVDFTEQLRRGGMALRPAIERAGEVRFLPVLLTSVTAIAGLTPLALEGSGLYSPLAIAIIGGLVTSTVLSRVATPVMYWLLSRGEKVVGPAAEPAPAAPSPAL